MIWLILGLFCINQVLCYNHGLLAFQTLTKSTSIGKSVSNVPNILHEHVHEHVHGAYGRAESRRWRIALEASSASTSESFDEDKPTSFEFSGSGDESSIAIDICTEDYCEILYKNDSKGEKGSAGAFILLDRDYKSPDRSHRTEYKFSATSVAILRKRFGSRTSVWGEWSVEETRTFYKQQLPRSLLEDGAMSLPLKERAQLAAEARHALRLYARERQKLPGRVLARATDGLRHLQEFGYWSSKGMSWRELLLKYRAEAHAELGDSASQEEIDVFCYERIIERSCVTNSAFDKLAEEGLNAVLKAKIEAGRNTISEFSSIIWKKPVDKKEC